MFQSIKRYQLNKFSGKRIAVILSLFMLTFAVSIPVVFALDFEPDNQVVFISHVGNTWTYNVTISGDCHWIIAWCGGNASIVGASHSWTYTDWTGIRGIWFSHPGEGQTVEYWFTLDDDYAEGTVDTAVQGLTANIYTGTVTGPVFTYTLVASTSGSGLGSTYMVANATIDYPDLSIVSVTFRWWGPYAPGQTPTLSTTPPETPNQTSTDTTSPFSDQYGPLVEDDLGDWYVEAEFNIANGVETHDKKVHAVIPVTIVPWFTSLPVALLGVVSLMFFLRRKGKPISPL